MLQIETKKPFANLTTQYSELTIHFQPIFTKNLEIFGYEALTRHISSKINIKQLFINAKKDGSIFILDMMCRRNAMKCANLQGISDYLFINTCAETLLHHHHIRGLTDNFSEEFKIPKEKIVLEITEETAIENYEIFIESVIYYKKRGYKVAIDDFGAGFGGPKMLSLIEPDIVKIDRHFISNITNNSSCMTFIEYTLSVCHSRNIKVVAEGIETYIQLREVVSRGVDLLQGYYLGKPSANIR